MSEEHCTVCHSRNRVTTPREGLTFNKEAHEKHHKLGINCAFCHNRIGHDTKDHENHLEMNWCLKECHASKAFVRKCTVCHTEEFAKEHEGERTFDVEMEKEGETESEHE